MRAKRPRQGAHRGLATINAHDPSEIRACALARALSRTSQRSTRRDRSELTMKRPARDAQPNLATIPPGRSPILMSCRRPGCSISAPRPVASIRSPNVGLARRPRPGPNSGRHRDGSADEFTPFATTPHVPSWPGWQHNRTPGCAGGRPRHRGTPVCDETVTAGCPRNDPVVRSSKRSDHRTVAALPTGRARPQVREARRASRNAPTPSVVAPPGPRHTAARNARHAHARSDGDSTGRLEQTAARISDRPTRGHPEIAPTPPTRARKATNGPFVRSVRTNGPFEQPRRRGGASSPPARHASTWAGGRRSSRTTPRSAGSRPSTPRRRPRARPRCRRAARRGPRGPAASAVGT